MDRGKPILKTRKRHVLKINYTNISTLILFTYDKEKEIIIEQKAGEKKKKKTTWIFLLINLVIVAAIFIYNFAFKETKPISELIAEKPFYRFFFIALAVVGVFYIISGIGYSILLKQTTGKFKFWLGLQLAIIGKYWDNITPFGSGGQFAQIAHGSKKGISGDTTTGVVVGKYMLGMLSFVFLGIISLFIPIDTFTTGTIIKILAIVGVVINLLVTLFIWIVSTNRKLCSVIVIGGLKLLHKMHIVKNFNRSLYKSMRFIKQYQKAFKIFIKKPWVVITEVLITFIESVLMALISYLVYLAFNFPTVNVSPITIFAMSFLCSFATSYIPIPGGSGMAEISFAALFSKLFSENITFWALMSWRVFTFYILILIGFLYTILDPSFAKANQKIQYSIQQRRLKRENRKKKTD